MLSREYIALESINSGFFNGIRGEHNYNKNLFSLLSKVDDDRFMGNWRVRFNQINTGTINGNICIDKAIFEEDLPYITKILFLKAVELRVKGEFKKSK